MPLEFTFLQGDHIVVYMQHADPIGGTFRGEDALTLVLENETGRFIIPIAQITYIKVPFEEELDADR